jgi:hypothetical protein
MMHSVNLIFCFQSAVMLAVPSSGQVTLIGSDGSVRVTGCNLIVELCIEPASAQELDT